MIYRQLTRHANKLPRRQHLLKLENRGAERSHVPSMNKYTIVRLTDVSGCSDSETNFRIYGLCHRWLKLCASSVQMLSKEGIMAQALHLLGSPIGSAELPSRMRVWRRNSATGRY